MGRARQLADGGLNDAILMDASAADTDVNDNILLEGTDSTSTDAGFNLLYEDGTHDASVALTPSSFTLDALNVSGTTTFESAVTADGTINSNAGITFPTEQVQSTTANVLDDYEEGTWTVDPDANIGGNLKKHLKALDKKMKEAASNLEFEEAAKIRDEIRKLESTELEITLNPKIRQYDVKNKLYPKGRSTMGMPGTKVTKKRDKKWKHGK